MGTQWIDNSKDLEILTIQRDHKPAIWRNALLSERSEGISNVSYMTLIIYIFH